MKRMCIILLVTLMLLAGCAANETSASVIENNPLFEVYVAALTLQADGELVEGKMFPITDVKQIVTMMQMFNGWEPDKNKADSAIDGWPDYRISFGNKQQISYFYPGEALGYICLIDNMYYYLPSAFGEYLDGVIAENLK